MTHFVNEGLVKLIVDFVDGKLKEMSEFNQLSDTNKQLTRVMASILVIQGLNKKVLEILEGK